MDLKTDTQMGVGGEGSEWGLRQGLPEEVEPGAGGRSPSRTPQAPPPLQPTAAPPSAESAILFISTMNSALYSRLPWHSAFIGI